MEPVVLLILGLVQAALLLLLAPLFSGLARVLRARVQTRQGPPLLQNYLDILKLMKRQQVISGQAGWAFRFTPYLQMAALLLLALLTPLLTRQSPLGPAGDLILAVYLLALPRFFFALAGLETGGTFAGIGGRRELLLSALVEPVLILAAFVMALLAGSTNLGAISGAVAGGTLPYSMAVWLALIAFAFAIFVEMGRLPYDVAEAEQELQEGPLAEYSGAALALMKWGLALKQLALAGLFLALFAPFGAMEQFSTGGLLLALLALLLKLAVLAAAVAVLENLMARARFIKAPALSWLALGAALLAFVFYLARV